MGSCKEHDIGTAIVLLKKSGYIDLLFNALCAYTKEIHDSTEEDNLTAGDKCHLDMMEILFDGITQVKSWKD